jgi:hypothetical protein
VTLTSTSLLTKTTWFALIPYFFFEVLMEDDPVGDVAGFPEPHPPRYPTGTPVLPCPVCITPVLEDFEYCPTCGLAFN